MALDILRKVGLSDGEIKVYSALLELGKAPINKVHEKTGIERRNIYDILNKLIEKGLVTYITENNKRSFQTTHPNKIIGYLEDKKYDLDKTKKDIEKELPEILNKFKSKKTEMNAEIYRGREGVKAVFEDMLNSKANYFIGSGRYVMRLMPHFWLSYNKRRKALKVKWYNIFRAELRKEVKQDPFVLEETKFLPKEFSANPNVIFIYGNKVANVLWTKDFFAFVIESKDIAENYKKYHNYLWNNVAKE